MSACSTGASPHTGGKPEGIVKNDMLIGIIPAYAGYTTLAHPALVMLWDHPRIRGVHYHRVL